MSRAIGRAAVQTPGVSTAARVRAPTAPALQSARLLRGGDKGRGPQGASPATTGSKSSKVSVGCMTMRCCTPHTQSIRHPAGPGCWCSRSPS